jgi:hypothetical protein
VACRILPSFCDFKGRLPAGSGGMGAAMMRDGDGEEFTRKIYRGYEDPRGGAPLGLAVPSFWARSAR